MRASSSRFSTAEPLQRLHPNVDAKSPECDLLFSASTVTAEQVWQWLNAGPNVGKGGAQTWFQQCTESFVHDAKRKRRYSWEEFAAQDAGRAVLSYEAYAAPTGGAERK